VNVGLVSGALIGAAVISAFAGRFIPGISKSELSEKYDKILLRTGTKLSNENNKALLKKTITQAGLDIEPEYFIGLQVALPTIAVIALTPLVLAGLDLFFLIPLVVLLYSGPRVWLNSLARKRVEAIEKALPDYCVTFATVLSAGADFLTAITEVAENMKGELGKEFLKTVDNMAVGDSRSKALGDMAARCGVADLTELVRKTDQAQRYGTPLADAVKLHAEQIMIRRRHEMQKKAGELTIKLLPVILLFCLLPMLGLLFFPIFYHLGAAFG